jgi:hypothetical protein
MATIKGKGIIAHVNGVAFTAGIVSATTLGAVQSFSHDRTSEKYEVKDANGATITQYFYDKKFAVAVQAVPYAADVAGARTSLDAWHLAPGTLVTTTDSDGNTEDNYNVISSRQGRSNTGAAVVDLVLEAGDEGIEFATAPIT